MKISNESHFKEGFNNHSNKHFTGLKINFQRNFKVSQILIDEVQLFHQPKQDETKLAEKKILNCVSCEKNNSFFKFPSASFHFQKKFITLEFEGMR